MDHQSSGLYLCVQCTVTYTRLRFDIGLEITEGSDGVEHENRQDENEPLTRQFRQKG